MCGAQHQTVWAGTLALQTSARSYMMRMYLACHELVVHHVTHVVESQHMAQDAPTSHCVAHGHVQNSMTNGEEGYLTSEQIEVCTCAVLLCLTLMT